MPCERCPAHNRTFVHPELSLSGTRELSFVSDSGLGTCPVLYFRSFLQESCIFLNKRQIGDNTAILIVDIVVVCIAVVVDVARVVRIVIVRRTQPPPAAVAFAYSPLLFKKIPLDGNFLIRLLGAF